MILRDRRRSRGRLAEPRCASCGPDGCGRHAHHAVGRPGVESGTRVTAAVFRFDKERGGQMTGTERWGRSGVAGRRGGGVVRRRG